MKIYEYMFVHHNNLGVGRIMVHRTKEISSHDELPDLDKFVLDNLKDKNIKQLVVTDFKLLRIYNDGKEISQ